MWFKTYMGASDFWRSFDPLRQSRAHPHEASGLHWIRFVPRSEHRHEAGEQTTAAQAQSAGMPASHSGGRLRHSQSVCVRPPPPVPVPVPPPTSVISSTQMSPGPQIVSPQLIGLPVSSPASPVLVVPGSGSPVELLLEPLDEPVAAPVDPDVVVPVVVVVVPVPGDDPPSSPQAGTSKSRGKSRCFMSLIRPQSS